MLQVIYHFIITFFLKYKHMNLVCLEKAGYLMLHVSINTCWRQKKKKKKRMFPYFELQKWPGTQVLEQEAAKLALREKG